MKNTKTIKNTIANIAAIVAAIAIPSVAIAKAMVAAGSADMGILSTILACVGTLVAVFAIALIDYRNANRADRYSVSHSRIMNTPLSLASSQAKRGAPSEREAFESDSHESAA